MLYFAALRSGEMDSSLRNCQKHSGEVREQQFHQIRFQIVEIDLK